MANTGDRRSTKIVCTLGPATSSPQALDELIEAGMDVARLNFSHGTNEEKAETVACLREAAHRVGRPVAILQDLSGPKVRTGSMANPPVVLTSGQILVLTPRDVLGNDREVGLTYKDLAADVLPGDSILLSDGALELVVEDVVEGDIFCKVVVGGALGSHKGINLPSRSLNVPALTSKDRIDLAFGIEQEMDFVALSFVKSAADVAAAKAQITESGSDIPVIAKIEKHEAVSAIDDILEVADGIMVARGDLGVDVPLERVPSIQKMLIAKANKAGKPVITATQMLKSMVDNPRPTRAEVTDVANAVLDGSDAVMLSEETAVGAYPIEAVRTIASVAQHAEETSSFVGWERRVASERMATQEAVALAACQTATRLNAAAILTFTQGGSTTRMVAKYKPRQTIIALTPLEETWRRLCLTWGAVPLRVPTCDHEEEMDAKAITIARENGYVEPGQTVIITAGVPLHVTGTTNMIKVAVV